jgi:hypothetical protein
MIITLVTVNFDGACGMHWEVYKYVQKVGIEDVNGRYLLKYPSLNGMIMLEGIFQGM